MKPLLVSLLFLATSVILLVLGLMADSQELSIIGIAAVILAGFVFTMTLKDERQNTKKQHNGTKS